MALGTSPRERGETRIRILVGDYLYITSAEALRRLIGWMSLAADIGENCSLEVRLAEISKLPSKPDSFHPKAWRIIDSSGGLLVVGSSNLSKAALENGGRFTVKKYHSVKRVTEDEWSHEHIELLPLNRDYNPIIVTPHEAPEMVVVGEWVSSIDRI